MQGNENMLNSVMYTREWHEQLLFIMIKAQIINDSGDNMILWYYYIVDVIT